jgi:F-type H+-transporting ATPase subunit b
MSSTMKRSLAALVMACGMIAVPAIAQEQGKSSSASEQTGNSGAEKPGMLIWQWINFAILVGVLGWIGSKQGGPYFAARAKSIAEGLAAGEKSKVEAAARAKAVDDRLGNLGNEIAEIRSSAREEREREADRIRRETEAEIARIRAHSGLELEAAGKHARLEVQRFAAKLAIDLAEQKLRSRISGEVQAALIDRFVQNLPDGGARATELVTRKA